MKTMTAQEVFDKSVGGIIAQGGPSMGPNGFCAYRGENNCKCAVGQVMDDLYYLPEYDCNEEGEGTTLSQLLRKGRVQPNLLPHTDLLIALQHRHDDMGSGITLEDFKERAKALAVSHGLEWSHE